MVKTLDQTHQPHPAVGSLAILVHMFTPGFKKHNPPRIPRSPQQAGVHTYCMPATLPARALPRAMRVNTHIIQKEQLARKDGRRARCSYQLLISFPLKRAYSCSEMANNWPPLPFRARKPKNSSDVAFGVWKGPHCDNRMLHMTPHKSKTTVTRKASECLHLAWCFRSSSSVLIQHPSMSRKSNRYSPPTSGYSLSVPTSWQIS